MSPPRLYIMPHFAGGSISSLIGTYKQNVNKRRSRSYTEPFSRGQGRKVGKQRRGRNRSVRTVSCVHTYTRAHLRIHARAREVTEVTARHVSLARAICTCTHVHTSISIKHDRNQRNNLLMSLKIAQKYGQFK